jgi:hypothetical protein
MKGSAVITILLLKIASESLNRQIEVLNQTSATYQYSWLGPDDLSSSDNIK